MLHLLALAAALALPGSATEDEVLAEAIDSWAAPLVEAGLISGRLLVALGDDVLCERSFGLANRELGVPIDERTRFCIASVTKPLTIALAARLIELEELALDDTLEKWLPGFENGERITVDHLLNHRAGFPHRVTSPAEETEPRDAAWVVERARSAKPLFAPGERSQYSSAGYSVLARVCELAGGKSCPELLRELVLEPAGARDSGHFDSRELVPGRAASYFALPRGSANGGYVNAPLKDTSFLVGAGSVWSTARDLHRIVRAIQAGTLGPAATAAMEAEDGLAWNGITNGFRAFVDLHAADGLIVCWTGNLHSGGDDLLRAAVPQLARGEELAPAAAPAVALADVPRAELARVEGLYRSPSQDLELRIHAGHATCGDRVLWPTSATTFFSPADFGTVTIALDSDGKPTGLEWVGPGFRLAWPCVGPLAAR
jgi:CubicO group peptidase (beta-lactamase class C family)